MLFDKKVKRGMVVMNERNRQYLEGFDKGDAPDDQALDEARKRQEEYHRLNDDVGLEKGDIPALVISAILVFGPIILILAAVMALAWFLLH